MPTINLNPTVRFVLYIVSAVGSAVAAYLFARGLVGDAELSLWAALVAIVNGIAAANTNNATQPPDYQRQILGKAFTTDWSKHEDGDPRRP